MYQKPVGVKEENIISIHEKTFNIKVNDLEFDWIETPGHASHHFSFLLKSKNIMFCGDSVGMLVPSLDSAMVPTTPHPYRMDSGIDSIKVMIEQIINERNNFRFDIINVTLEKGNPIINHIKNVNIIL